MRTFGDDAGITLMELLPPVGWADVATKQDLELLELKLEAKLERGFRQVLVTVASLTVSGFVATIAVVLAR